MPTPGSFEWLREQITKAIQAEQPALDFSIEETHPDHVIIRSFPSGEQHSIAYTCKADGDVLEAVSVGELVEVPQEWTAVTKGLRMLVPVQKAGAEARRITLGVVLEPDSFDLQGDVMTTEDIELSAHAWMENSQAAGHQHVSIVKGAKPVESYLAPCDFAVQCADGTEEIVTKGSWVLGMRWPEAVWKRIAAGEITGYSVGGRGVRIPILEEASNGSE